MRLYNSSPIKALLFTGILMFSVAAIAQPAAPGAGPGAGKGYHKGHMMSRCKHMMWMHTLTIEQKKKLISLKFSYKSKKLLLKAKKKQHKIELALLVTTDKPDTAAINKKLDEILALKKKIMLEKISHLGEVRNMLTAEQKPMFDLHVLKKMSKGKGRGKGRYRHH